jgi:hypothetical protein
MNGSRATRPKAGAKAYTNRALLGLAAIALGAAGCPLMVADDYEVTADQGSEAIKDPGSSGEPVDPAEDGCDDGYMCAPFADDGPIVRIELAGVAHCPVGWGSPSTFSDGTDPGCPCACSSASSGACEPGKIIEFETASCGPGEDKKDHSPDAAGDCVDVYTGASGLKLEAPSATPGTCAASDPSPTPLGLRSCELAEPPGKSCGAGKVCLPSIGPPPARLCNVVPPGASCAEGFAPDRTIYRVSEDTRACACSCGAASPATCVGASVELYSGKGCSSSLDATLPAGSPCGDATGFDALGSVKVSTGTWVGGQCEPNAKVSGSVKIDTLGAFTLCCAIE